MSEGKDKACEGPCMACGSNDRDDLILVCDRDKCYSYFHCYCLPMPLDAPPEVSKVYLTWVEWTGLGTVHRIAAD